LGRYASGYFDLAGANISAYDPDSQRIFVDNVAAQSVDVLDIHDPTTPKLLFSIDVTPYGHHPDSVAVRDGVIAVSVEAFVKTDPGKVVLFDADGTPLSTVTVGPLPDMITFTPDGTKLLVANEGEPSNDYLTDPEGSISIIDVRGCPGDVTQGDVVTVGFTAFNSTRLDPSVRIYGPGATVAQDLEPEYIAVSHDSKTAWITLQENNAMAILDIKRAKIVDIVGLGYKDHRLPGNALDASDRDGGINIASWPVYGLYEPDGVVPYKYRGKTFLVTANEGDTRGWAGYNEEVRVKDIVLDPVAFPNAAALRADAALGRLTVTKAQGDVDHDGDYDQLFVPGGRSFSIWAADGSLVFDSGDDLERRMAALYPTTFNSDNKANNSFDTRSDNKGPEPEGIVLGKHRGRTYAFIGLERIGGVIAYDVTNPYAPTYATYINTRDFAGNAAAGTAGDLGPEGLFFVKAEDSPNQKPLLVVSYETSGSVAIFQID
jgi:hypothetical protein